MVLKRQSLILIMFILLIKEILVFNEEFLILLSFILFIYIFSKFIKYHIYIELSNQTLDIQKDFILYDKNQLNLNLNLHSYYFFQKILVLDLLNIISFINNTIKLLFQKYLLLLKKTVYNLIDTKFKKLIIVEKKLKQDIQKQIVYYISKNISYSFKLKSIPSFVKSKVLFKNQEFLFHSINVFLKI